MGAFFVRTGSPNKFDIYADRVQTYATATISGTQITITGTYYCAWKINLSPDTYFIRYDNISGTGHRVVFHYTDGTITSQYTRNNIVTLTKQADYIYLYCSGSSQATAVYDKVAINKSNTLINGNYYPYVPNSRMQIADWHSNVPSGYVEVEYLESSGTQYIDSGVKLNQNSKVVIDFQINQGSPKARVCGARDTTSSKSLILSTTSGNALSNTYWYLNYGTQVVDTLIASTNVLDRNVFSIGQTWIINNIIVKTFNYETFETPYNMYVFAYRHTAGIMQETSMKLYSCKIYDNNTLVRNFIPAVRLSDGEAGLYDLVNDVFYTNQGTGKFTYGKFKNIPSGYAQVDLGTLDFTKATVDATLAYFTATLPNGKVPEPNSVYSLKNVFCSKYKQIEQAYWASDTPCYFIQSSGTQTTCKIVFGFSNSQSEYNMTNAEFKTAMNGVWILYEKA